MGIILAEMKEKGLTYNEFINDFLTKNFDELMLAAKKDVINTDFEPEDLLLEMVQHLYSNKEKIMSLEKIKGKDRPLMRFACDYMFNHIRVFQKPNKGLTNFRAKFQLKKDGGSDLVDKLSHIIPDVDYDTERKKYKRVYVKEILDDVIQTELNEQEKKLYNWIITEKLNVPKMIKLIGGNISEYTFYKMIKALKLKIKTKCDERRK